MIQNYQQCSKEKSWWQKEWNVDGGRKIFLKSDGAEGSQGTGFTFSAEMTTEETVTRVICVLADWPISLTPFVAHATVESSLW